MKLASQVSDEKLRGGFYTPPRLVAACLDRIAYLSYSTAPMSILEPSVGDGAFIRGLGDHPLCESIDQFVGIEITPGEAVKAQSDTDLVPFHTSIHITNVLEWCVTTDQWFEAAVGNPPFVRYQFNSDSDVTAISRLGRHIGAAFRGVSNLWIPVFLGALSRLRVGGAMAFVVPAELFTGVSAGIARGWLLSNFDRLQVDLFEPGTFPNVLQEVIVISGNRVKPSSINETRQVDFVEHFPNGTGRSWSHDVHVGGSSWTRCLLTPQQLTTLHRVVSRSAFRFLGDVARLEVSVVTGANSFFSVTSKEAELYNIRDWTEPLLPRIRYAPGLVYRVEDQDVIARSDAKAWLLDFSASRPDPLQFHGAAQYLAMGEADSIHERYKTSIRSPWYRVPSIWTGKLLLSKRSHWFPRLVLNEAGALTTDTIYRGNMLPIYAGMEKELVAGFHNSLTILTAELEGRSFGGGVLELVPSEISRLVVPFPTGMSCYLEDLDKLARRGVVEDAMPEDLIDATDEILLHRLPEITAKDLDEIRDARKALLKRRLDRN